MKKLIALMMACCASSLLIAQQNGTIFNTAIDAYIYGYPLVLMETTKKAMTDVSFPTKDKAPINQFANLREFPTPDFEDVVSPNADTLYSSAWLDLSKEPIVLSVPDTGNRYYLLPLLSGWTDVFASIGTRTTGNEKRNFAIVGPFWKGNIPNNLEVIHSPTHMVWILGRTKTNGTSDYEAVHAIQDQYKLTPLSAWNNNYHSSRNRPVTQDNGADIAPVDEVNGMDALAFFSKLAELLKSNPPKPEDKNLVESFYTIGLVPGKDFDPSRLTPEQLGDLNRGLKKAQDRIVSSWKNQSLTKNINGWTLLLDKVGDYGTDYFLRAAVAYGGLGANLPQDAVYPRTRVDSQDRPLNGRNNYVIHFDKGSLPPAKAFWSLTMYNDRQFFVENPIDRYALGDKDKLQFNRDGSLDIYIQYLTPGKEKESNWLPSPSGNFNLIMRLYEPTQEVLDGTWAPPAVERVN